MLDVFTAPTRAFTRLKEKPRWLVPVIVIVVVSVIAAVVTTRFVDWNEQRQAALDRLRERNMSEEQVQRATEQMDKFFGNPAMRYGAPLVSAFFTSLVAILFLTVVYNVSLPLLGSPGNFVRTLTVVTNAGLVSIAGSALRIVLVIIKRSPQVTTSLLAAFPGVKDPFLSMVLAQVDPFAFWQLILAGLGLKVVFDTRGSRSYWLVFAVWIVWTLIMAALGGRAATFGR